MIILLKIGDKVKIRSKLEIEKTLDSFSKYQGCLFTSFMRKHCNKEYKILKVVRNILDEATGKMSKCHGDNVYILDGILCDGIIESFKEKCDRSCFIFWKGSWLEKIE